MRSVRVLVIEDSEGDFELLLGHLRGGGYDGNTARVQTAATLVDALERQAWDVVLADWSMPLFSALEALRIVRRHESGFALHHRVGDLFQHVSRLAPEQAARMITLALRALVNERVKAREDSSTRGTPL